MTPLAAERALFAIFLFALPLQTRWFIGELGFSAARGEWTGAWIWASDLAFALVYLWWCARAARLRDFSPFLVLLVALPALLTHGTAVGLWAFAKLAEAVALFTYVRARGALLSASPVPLAGFLLGVGTQALVALFQFVRQGDLGLSWLDESPIAADIPGVAKFSVAGAHLIRGYGLTPHPNILASLCVAGLIGLAFFYLVRGVRLRFGYRLDRQKEELMLGLSVFLLSLGLVVTFSRSGLLAAGTGIAVLFSLVFWRRRLRGRFGWEAMRFAVLLAAVGVMLWWVFAPLLLARAAAISQDEALGIRRFLNGEAVAMVISAPLTGVGPGGFVTALAERNPALPSWALQPVHNVALLVTAEYGIAAAAALALLLLFLLARLWRRIASSENPNAELAGACLLAILSALIVFGFADHFLWTTQQGRFLSALALGFAAAGFPREGGAAS